MNSKKVKPQIIVLACEGDAEALMLEFLKRNTDHKSTIKIENLKGVENLKGFEKKVKTTIAKYSRRLLKKIDITFIFDNDLEELALVTNFLKSNHYSYIQLDPNIEGFLFELAGLNIGENQKTQLYRRHCKSRFINHFKKEACNFKDKDWVALFGKEGSQISHLQTKSETLRKLIKLISTPKAP